MGKLLGKRAFRSLPKEDVAANALYPVISSGKNPDGDAIITTGDGKGSMVRYTFTK